MSAIETVLVTGASGFIALHTIKKLLDAGHTVRGTLRTPERGEKLKEILKRHGTKPDRLSFVAADLTKDEGWDAACAGCSRVLHIASPFPGSSPKNEDELIIPARDGTLRVLRAAVQAGVTRVVMTSSIAAVSAGLPRSGRSFNEDDWSDVKADIGAYAKSKTLAEMAAWDFVDQLPDDGKIELVTINPGAVLGPVMEEDTSTSILAISALMKHAYPACPQLGWALVDVRDVADAHIAAMTAQNAAGHRYICANEHVWMQDMANILQREFGPRGYRIPTGKLPKFVMHIVALFDPAARLVLGDLGKRTDLDNAAIKRDLAWNPLPTEQTIIDTATSLISAGLV